MRFGDAAERLQFAENINEVRPGAQLSDLIQRALDSSRRTGEIATYLTDNSDHFFNSLVVAVYGGEPTWIEFGVARTATAAGIEDIPEWTQSAFGFLKLSGEEKLFPVDGQHRLAGIKEAVRRDPDLLDERITVLFVAHSTSLAGRKRTRKLFTTLNKTAVPVGKSDIIALDESDTAAIITRRLVEQHPMFSGGQVLAKYNTSNLSQDDSTHFVTIIKLYDIVGFILLRIMHRFNRDTAAKLKYVRPSEDKLEDYYQSVATFLEEFIATFPELRSYFKAKGNAAHTIVAKQRHKDHNVLYRSVGLDIFLRLIARASEDPTNWRSALKQVAKLPRKFTDVPYRHVLYSVSETKILTGRTRLTIKLLLHMLGYDTDEALKEKYADALGAKSARLPARLKPS